MAVLQSGYTVLPCSRNHYFLFKTYLSRRWPWQSTFSGPGYLGSVRGQTVFTELLLHWSLVLGLLPVLRRQTSVVAVYVGSELRLPGLRSASITFASCASLGHLFNFSELPFPCLQNAEFVADDCL